MEATKKSNSVLVVVDDMFFASKIRGTAEATGATVTIVKSKADVERAVDSGSPALIIVDLNSQRIDPLDTIKKLKARPDLDAPIIGFLSHVQTDLKEEAEQAGCDRVMPRSVFARMLPEILGGRY